MWLKVTAVRDILRAALFERKESLATIGQAMVVADCRAETDLTFGAAAYTELTESAGRILKEDQHTGHQDKRDIKMNVQLTDGQHASPQHFSPGLQKVSEQQVDFLGMQKGATFFDWGMQQASVYTDLVTKAKKFTV